MAGSEQRSSAARVPVCVEVFEMDNRELARKHGHHAAGAHTRAAALSVMSRARPFHRSFAEGRRLRSDMR